jgi:glycolate oxidase FAD binding subunit
MDAFNDTRATEVLASLRERMTTAARTRTPLSLHGGGTHQCLRPKAFGEPLSLADYAGVIDYAPSELVIVARAGTRLLEIEALLAEHGQQLAFEPPRSGADATLGGVIATGLSGPARPYAAAVRDHVLGLALLSTRGEVLQFGGKVMKNVAGYDVSRLVVGAWGAFGPMLELAVRVVPRPALVRCLRWPMPLSEAQGWMQSAGSLPWPLSGLCHDGECLHVRFAGAESAVVAAVDSLPAGALEESEEFWTQLRDWQLPFFQSSDPLWRLVLPPATPQADIPGAVLWDWGGGQRWFKSAADDSDIKARVAAAGGYARRFDASYARRDADLPPARRALEARLRQSFDPYGLFNPELSAEEG